MTARRIAVLIDGGFFLKRLPALRPDIDRADPAIVAKAVNKTVGGHLFRLNRTYHAANPWSLLHRAYFYDAAPFEGTTERPVSRTRLDYSRTEEAKFRRGLHEELRRTRKFAVRLGDVYRESGWRLTEAASKAIRNGTLLPDDLTDDHFSFGLRQKGVDMRIGADMATLALKKHADIIILLAGDSDFVTTAKLARREGVEVILDPMGGHVRPSLFEHIDGVQRGLPRRQLPSVNELEQER